MKKIVFNDEGVRMKHDFERYWYKDIRQIDSLKQMLAETRSFTLKIRHSG